MITHAPLPEPLRRELVEALAELLVEDFEEFPALVAAEIVTTGKPA
jgi:hypothetical protein